MCCVLFVNEKIVRMYVLLALAAVPGTQAAQPPCSVVAEPYQARDRLSAP